MATLHLYHTLGCHLCELAEDVIAQFNQTHPDQTLHVQKIDIADDDALVERYGVRIPVVKFSTVEATLDWPFDLASLEKYVIESK